MTNKCNATCNEYAIHETCEDLGFVDDKEGCIDRCIQVTCDSSEEEEDPVCANNG